MHKFTFRLESDYPTDESRIVEVSFDKGDGVTYMQLLEEFKYFLLGCGYDYLHGTLVFDEMEEEETLKRLAKPEKKVT